MSDPATSICPPSAFRQSDAYEQAWLADKLARMEAQGLAAPAEAMNLVRELNQRLRKVTT